MLTTLSKKTTNGYVIDVNYKSDIVRIYNERLQVSHSMSRIDWETVVARCEEEGAELKDRLDVLFLCYPEQVIPPKIILNLHFDEGIRRIETTPEYLTMPQPPTQRLRKADYLPTRM